MKRRIAAACLCATFVLGACASGANVKEQGTSEPQAENTQKSEEKEYQKKLDLINPSAYNNVEGLNLEPGSYLSVIGRAESGSYWEEVKKGAEQAVKDMNEMLGYEGKEKIKVTYSGPATGDSVDEQVNILDEELARYPVALGIAITDANACEVQFDLAAESDIPVVAFDSGSDYQGLMATVATDNGAAAKEAASYLAEQMEDSGEALVFVQDSKSKSAAARENAFREEIEQNHPGITIAQVYHLDQLEEMQKQVADEINAGTYSKEEGVLEGGTVLTGEDAVLPESITEEEVVDYIFAKHPNANGVFAANEDAMETALGGLERLEDGQDIAVTGYDAGEEEIQALKEGKIDGLVVQNPFGMGYATVVAAARAALGMGNEAVVDTGYTWVTKENLKEEAIQKILY